MKLLVDGTVKIDKGTSFLKWDQSLPQVAFEVLCSNDYSFGKTGFDYKNWDIYFFKVKTFCKVVEGLDNYKSQSSSKTAPSNFLLGGEVIEKVEFPLE